MEQIFYVYVYIDPRKPTMQYGDFTFQGEPFYVGKGKGKRAWIHLRESLSTTHNTLKVQKIQRIIQAGCSPSIVFVQENMVEEHALELEKKLIVAIGTKWNIQGIGRGPLCNMTSGGEGRVPCDELRERFSQKGSDNGMWGRTHTEEVKQRIREFRKTFKHTEETRMLMSKNRSKGKNYTTKKWIVVLPNKTQIVVHHLAGFCLEHKINYNSLYNSYKNRKPISRGKATGYWLKEPV